MHLYVLTICQIEITNWIQEEYYYWKSIVSSLVSSTTDIHLINDVTSSSNSGFCVKYFSTSSKPWYIPSATPSFASRMKRSVHNRLPKLFYIECHVDGWPNFGFGRPQFYQIQVILCIELTRIPVSFHR